MLIKMQDKETGLTTFHKVTLTYPLLYSVLLKVKKKAWAFSMGKGICYRIEIELEDMGYRHLDRHDNVAVHRLMRSWNEFSGDIEFPIHTNKRQAYPNIIHRDDSRIRQRLYQVRQATS